MMQLSLPIGRPGNQSVTSEVLFFAQNRPNFGDKWLRSRVKKKYAIFFEIGCSFLL